MGRSTAAIAGVVGLSFGSGAFTETTATRDFTIDVADDESSQIVVEENDDIETDSVSFDDGVFEIDSSGISPSAKAAYGDFNDIDDVETLETGVFVIRNENETEEDVDIEVSVDIESGGGTIDLAADESPDGSLDDSNTTSDGDDPAEVTGVGHTNEVEVGFVVDTEGDTIDAELTIEAELNGGG